MADSPSETNMIKVDAHANEVSTDSAMEEVIEEIPRSLLVISTGGSKSAYYLDFEDKAYEPIPIHGKRGQKVREELEEEYGIHDLFHPESNSAILLTEEDQKRFSTYR